MKHVDTTDVETSPKKPLSFYERTFKDIEHHERALIQAIEEFHSDRQQLLRLQAQLPNAPSRPCIFCGGCSRDLSMVSENFGAFGGLGSGALTLERERGYGPVPERWECQECGAFDLASPGDARMWSRDKLPSRGTLSRQMLGAFPAAQGVAFEETSYGTLWMLQVDDTWYVLPGTGAQIVDRLRSRSACPHW